MHTLQAMGSPTVNAMLETCTREISKAEVEQFLFGKHITACPACGRFRSQCELEVHSITCQRAPATSLSGATAPVPTTTVVEQPASAAMGAHSYLSPSHTRR